MVSDCNKRLKQHALIMNYVFKIIVRFFWISFVCRSIVLLVNGEKKVHLFYCIAARMKQNNSFECFSESYINDF